MPNRILREGILTSARVDRLSVPAELFYRRLQSKVDDQGRYEAHPELLRSACYPLRVDRIRARHVVGWLAECEVAGLLVTYKAGSKAYLQLLDWRQQVRAESKIPDPDEALLRKRDQMISDATHLKSIAHLGGGEGGGEVLVEGGGEIASRASPRSALNGDAVAYITLNDGTEWGVDKAYAEELAKLFPAVDVPQTLNEIRAWNIANPARRKTLRGIRHHITTWMAKEQNGGPQAGR